MNVREKIRLFKASFETNVFVMMRYSKDPKFTELEEAIRSAVVPFGLTARLAKDAALYDDLWKNIGFYMTYSRYGVAVFDELEDREFNPNISMELGYMLALKRKCLLLKDRRMRALPTDICGKIYRDFDPYKLRESIAHEVSKWCLDDLALQPLDESPQTEVEKWIAEEVDMSRFRSRRLHSQGLKTILHEFEDGESRYVVWHEAKQRLYKYCKEGPRWFAPERLSRADEQRVREVILNGASNTVTTPDANRTTRGRHR